MTSELIERVARAIYLAFAPEGARWELVNEHYQETVWRKQAQAAIRVIAPAVLEEAIAQCEWPEEAELNNEFARGMATACCLNRDAIRALKTRYEQ